MRTTNHRSRGTTHSPVAMDVMRPADVFGKPEPKRYAPARWLKLLFLATAATSILAVLFGPRDVAAVIGGEGYESAPTTEAERLEPAPLSDAELRALGLRARETNDEPLRRLVTGYLTLRRLTADVVAFVEAREGAAVVANTPLLRAARRLADAKRR